MVTPKPNPSESTYELLQHGEQIKSSIRSRHGVLSFLLSQPLLLSTLTLGLLLALTSFAFTFWLSNQSFSCPDWALYCRIPASVALFATHLAQVQGIVGAIFSLAITMMAYSTYLLSETSLWPLLAKSSFALRDVDSFLATTRGSLPSAPFALSKAKGPAHILLLLLVSLIGVLQLADSIIVGHAYSLGNVTTTFTSNHSSGGGVGFGFSQGGLFPGAVGQAISTYNSWAFELSVEPMPEYRNFLIDRAKLTTVGDFVAKAVEANTAVNCSGRGISILKAELGGSTFSVNTTRMGAVSLRQQPVLTAWVDNWRNTSNTSAITTVMFAVINGSIEGGHQHGPDLGYKGISSLACDVDVSLKDSTICTYSDNRLCGTPSTVLSSLDTLHNGGAPYNLAVYMASGVTIFGNRIDDTQPMYLPHSALESSSLTNGTLAAQLPIAFTTTTTASSYNFSQEVLRNFIQVGAGALTMSFMQSWPDRNVTLQSTLPMRRMVTGRTWILLMPPALVLGSIVIVAILCAVLYRSANIDNVRLGTTSEVVISSQTNDINAVVHEARSSSLGSTRMLSRLRVRYGIVAEGYDGLARKENVLAFTSRKVEDLRAPSA